MPRYYLLLSLLCLVLPTLAATPVPSVQHKLQVKLMPDQGQLDVHDRILLPAPVTDLTLYLHSALEPRLIDTDARITKVKTVRATVPLKQYTIQFDTPSQSLTLQYTGKIFHQLNERSNGYAGGRNASPGLIDKQGVFLAGSSYWYPQLKQPFLVSFSLAVDLPEGWVSVSQGEAIKTDHWRELQPQDDIYLIAAPFHVYQQQTPIATAQVFLRQADATLAQRYLDATEHYLKLFQSLLGEYPYSKFALVENFWDTGYGMPSFTLLGPRVIRLPFILHSSYPHEILHNWWGNSVYIDYSSGNWAEGLTAYLADHLLKEQAGKGADYRRNSLQKYADYVSKEADFPLAEFVAHHGEVSQAIGYSKALMMFHMLRRQLGDEDFIAGLRRFYADNRFRNAGYNELRKAFEQQTGTALADFFQQWTSRSGAPALTLDRLSVTGADNSWQLQGRLQQTQSAAAFQLDSIPLFVQLQGHEQAMAFNLQMTGKSLDFSLPLPAEPLRVSVDPRFDLFRTLLDEELPASLGQLFGADELTIVLPSTASEEMKQAWQQMLAKWQQGPAELHVLWDDQIDKLPADGNLWLLGGENKLVSQLAPSLKPYKLRINDSMLNFRQTDYSLQQNSLALAVAHPHSVQATVGLISAASPELVPTLARKLPHYGRYSLTLFAGERVTNQLKLQWPVTNSPLQVQLKAGEIPAISIPPLAPLTDTQ